MKLKLSLAILTLLAVCLTFTHAGDRYRVRERHRVTTTYSAPVYLGTTCSGQRVYAAGCVGTTTVRSSVRVRGSSCVGSSCVGSGCTGTVRTRTTYSSSWR